jgi:SAM-dependent methyltransferase
MRVANLPRMFTDLAGYWPLMSPPEDYAFEAGFWRDVLLEKLGPGKHPVLELGVGGGHNLFHLTGEFQATAVDISEPMLDNSRKLNPGVEHIQGDMRSIRLNREFRAVLVHDAISYLLNEQELLDTFHTAGAHLGKGGVLITTPDYTTETFEDGTIHTSTRAFSDVELTRLEYSWDPDPDDSLIETLMVFLIREDGRVRVEQDRHLTGLFPLARWFSLLDQSGFTVEKRDYPVYDDGIPAVMLVGVKR